jgi:hypothetical protein
LPAWRQRYSGTKPRSRQRPESGLHSKQNANPLYRGIRDLRSFRLTSTIRCARLRVIGAVLISKLAGRSTAFIRGTNWCCELKLRNWWTVTVNSVVEPSLRKCAALPGAAALHHCSDYLKSCDRACAPFVLLPKQLSQSTRCMARSSLHFWHSPRGWWQLEAFQLPNS